MGDEDGGTTELYVGAAAALLGEYAHPNAVAAVAGVSLGETLRVIDRLAERDHLHGSGPVGFARPELADAYLKRLPPGRRALMHGYAAGELKRRGAPLELVARHLLDAPGSGDRAVVDVLVAQAESRLDGGQTDRALRCLSRALHEPPDSDQLPGLLLVLARTHLAAGDNDQALAAAERALDRAVSPAERVPATEVAYRALVRSGEVERALHLISVEIERLAPTEPEAAVRLEIALLREAPTDTRVLQEGLRRHVAIGPSLDRTLPAVADYELEIAQIKGMGGGASAAEAVRLVEPALRLGAASKDDPTPLLRTVWLLSRAEAPGPARDLCASIARQLPSRADHPALEAVSGLLELRFGGVETAVETLSRATRAAEEGRDAETLSMARSFHAHALLEAGELETLAERYEGFSGVLDRLWEVLAAVALARGRLLRGEFEPAAQTLTAVEEVKLRLGLPNPAGFDHLSYAVIALTELGELERAAPLAELNLRRCADWGAPGTLALAEAAAARTRPARSAVPLLEAALHRAASSTRRTVEAEVALELGRALQLANHARRAGDAFHLALDAASRARAPGLIARAREALALQGRRPRRDYASGIEALTEAELRAARLAAAGWQNRRIAAHAHLSVRTVENHLRSAYRKLGTDRAGLAEALAAERAGE